MIRLLASIFSVGVFAIVNVSHARATDTWKGFSENPTGYRRSVVDNPEIFIYYFNTPFFKNFFSKFPATRPEFTWEQISAFIIYANDSIKYHDPGDASPDYLPKDRIPGGPIFPRTPAQIQSSHKGDCKEKSVWLLSELNDPTALLAYGKLRAGSKRMHAWVYYFKDGLWWIFDPTNTTEPRSVRGEHNSRYFPLYTINRKGVFKYSWPAIRKKQTHS